MQKMIVVSFMEILKWFRTVLMGLTQRAIVSVYRDSEWIYFDMSRFEFYKKLYGENKDPQAAVERGYRSSIFKRTKIVVCPKIALKIGKSIKRRFITSYLDKDSTTHSLFNLNGDRWAIQRKLLSYHAFKPSFIDEMSDVIEKCATDTCGGLLTFDGTRTIDCTRLARLYGTLISYRCVFGCYGSAAGETGGATPRAPSPSGGVVSEIECGSTGDMKFAYGTKEIEFENMARKFRNADSLKIGVFGWLFKILEYMGFVSDYKRAVDYFQNLVETNKNYGSISFLTAIAALGDSNIPGLEVGDVGAHCMVFLLGGYTSTSSAVSFTIYELAKNETVQTRLYEEISDPTLMKEPMREQFKQYKYLDSVIKEVLRMYPPFAAITRHCETDLVYKGLSNGDHVVIPVSGLHYDSRYYDEPDSFKPERFHGTTPMEGKYIPFGIGNRKCIGEYFATYVIKTFIVVFLRNCRVSTASEYGKEERILFSPRKFTTSVKSLNVVINKR